MRRVAKCGTLSGYARHRRLGEEACAECLRANNERSRNLYRDDPDRRAQVRARTAAAERAYSRLAHMYPDDYAALYAEEKERGA
jgi:hypothetical protein